MNMISPFIPDISRVKILRSLCYHFSTYRQCKHSKRCGLPEFEQKLQRRLERFYQPCSTEEKMLRKKYSDPAGIINDLYRPLIESNTHSSPTLEFYEKFNGRLWKAVLHLSFPSTFTSVGIHKDKAKARENAYLTACDLYWNTGLLNLWEGTVSGLTPCHVLTLLEKLCLQTSAPHYRTENNFEIRTSQIGINGEISWLTELQIRWPIDLSVKASGRTPYSSQYLTALNAGIKLKTLDLLNHDNEVYFDVTRYLRGAYIASKYIPNVEDFQADCVIHVDASKKGIGAFLEMKDENGVRWFTETWPKDLKANYFSKSFPSSFGEMYAFVTACYTWKHKFVNKRVLCNSDCLSTVQLINRGLYVSRKTYSKFYKLNNILLTTIHKYNIEFLASYIPRLDNVAADLLSRQKVDQFREQVPNAYEKAKKIKKLAFFHPLIDKISYEESHKVEREKKKRKLKKITK